MAEIPDWAVERAVEMANTELRLKYHPAFASYSKNSGDTAALSAFAKYIAEHEEPPVDPDLIMARRIAAMSYDWRPENLSNLLDGVWDRKPLVQAVLRAIKETRNEAN